MKTVVIVLIPVWVIWFIIFCWMLRPGQRLDTWATIDRNLRVCALNVGVAIVNIVAVVINRALS